MSQRTVLALLVALTVLCVTGLSQVMAGQYPEKPITIIVPYKPGGGTDTNARVIEKFATVPRLVAGDETSSS